MPPSIRRHALLLLLLQAAVSWVAAVSESSMASEQWNSLALRARNLFTKLDSRLPGTGRAAGEGEAEPTRKTAGGPLATAPAEAQTAKLAAELSAALSVRCSLYGGWEFVRCGFSVMKPWLLLLLLAYPLELCLLGERDVAAALLPPATV